MVSPALTVLPIDGGAAVAVEAHPEAQVAGGGGAGAGRLDPGRRHAGVGAAGGGVAGPVNARGPVADAAARTQRRSPGSSSV
jgi:hypothetical protein